MATIKDHAPEPVWQVGDTIELVPERRHDRVRKVGYGNAWPREPLYHGGVIRSIDGGGIVVDGGVSAGTCVIEAAHARYYRLVPQPEPAPERPEWVRITQRYGEYRAGVVCRTVEPDEATEDVTPGWVLIDGTPGGFTEAQWTAPGYWEPADPPTPEPPTTCAICDGTGSSAGRNRTPGLIGWSPCHSCGGSGKAAALSQEGGQA